MRFGRIVIFLCAGLATLGTALGACGKSMPGPARRLTVAEAKREVLFSGTGLRGWQLNQSAAPNRIQLVRDPDGANDRVLRFVTFNSDIAPLTPTDNPRSQLVTSERIIQPDRPYWESYEVYLPTDFPVSRTYRSWVALNSPVYGRPFDGTSPVVLSIENGHFRWQANGFFRRPWAIFWQQKLQLGRWVRFTWYVDPSVTGFAELYVNDQPVVTHDLGHRTHGVSLPIFDPANSIGPWESQLQLYYEHDAYPYLMVYFKDFRIAETKFAAEAQLAGRG